MTQTVKVLEDNLGHIVAYNISKEEREVFIKRVIQAVEDGSLNTLDLHLYLKQTETILDAIIKNPVFKDELLKEASKYGKSFDFRNASVQIREAGVKYDYSGCNDAILDDLEVQMAELKEKLAERQKFLKGLPVIGANIISEDGEVFQVFPPTKSSTTTIAVTLK